MGTGPRGPSICLKGVPEEKNGEASGEELSEERMAENTSELKKESPPVVLDKILKQNNTSRHIEVKY